jgi:hypothetical protein
MSQQPNQQKNVIEQLSELLNITPKQLLVEIRKMGREPGLADLSWKDAIASHLKGQKPPVLNDKPPEPESFSLDEDELMDWGELEEELGQGVLVLARELGYSTEGKISVSDAEAIREMLTLDSVHESLGEKIIAAEGLQQGFAEQYVQDQLEVGRAIAEAGNIALTTGFFQGKVNGLQQISELSQTLHGELLGKLTQDTVKVGTMGKGESNQIVMTLGKQEVIKQNARQKKKSTKSKRFNLENIRSSAKK